jgi:hypothetical protein
MHVLDYEKSSPKMWPMYFGLFFKKKSSGNFNTLGKNSPIWAHHWFEPKQKGTFRVAGQVEKNNASRRIFFSAATVKN